MDGSAARVRVSLADPARRRVTAGAKCGCGAGCRAEDGAACCGAGRDGAIVAARERPAGRLLGQIPEEIRSDAALAAAIAVLPANYNFEIHKSVWQVRRTGAQRVALQLPEGFQMYALVLSDIHVRFGGCAETVVLGDVTYGACCIDDYTAALLGCDLIIHYGHSCLVPVTHTKVPVLYVFVEIAVPHANLLATLEANFAGQRVALMATVQFAGVLHVVRPALAPKIDLYIPQIRPLSPGEVLGCTAPRLPADTDALLFLADGRFHLEAAMIANPKIAAYRYDPFTQRVTAESYDHLLMLRTRQRMIERARGAAHFGVILGTLGRQGSPAVVRDLVAKLRRHGCRVTVVLMSEVRPERLSCFVEIDAWVQTSCPRLSIDWNYAFGEDTPLLTPYELNVMLGDAPPFCPGDAPPAADGAYPMDFYATGDAAHHAGPWTPGFHLRPPRAPR